MKKKDFQNNNNQLLLNTVSFALTCGVSSLFNAFWPTFWSRGQTFADS
jgi:hypothetical protein